MNSSNTLVGSHSLKISALSPFLASCRKLQTLRLAGGGPSISGQSESVVHVGGDDLIPKEM